MTDDKDTDEIAYLNDFVSKLDNREETIDNAKYVWLSYNQEYERLLKNKGTNKHD